MIGYIPNKEIMTMKVERQLAIITYLLNRDIVRCKQLAERFEVTERTIQRDVESINMAGIPIVSIRGINGGYKILDTYSFSKQTATKSDLELLSIALKSLHTAIDNDGLKDTIEKLDSIKKNDKKSNLSIDFGIAKESKKVSKFITEIKNAIKDSSVIEFEYFNSNNKSSQRVVEPISLNFKWYSWYLTAFCLEKRGYRIFKLIRMNNIKKSAKPIENNHDDPSSIFENLISKDTRKTTKILMKYKKYIHNAIEEYIDNITVVRDDENEILAEAIIIESERKWFAFLLSFGEDVEVVKPSHIRERLVNQAKKIIDKYKIPDI